MTHRHARLGLVLSLAVLLTLVLAWAWWPQGDGRADLRAVAPVATTTAPPATDGSSAGSTPPPTTAAPIARAVPTRLRIPGIGVDAAVVPVGLAPNRQMEVPAAADVGWYRLGPSPGDNGSAVLAAHIDYGGEEGAFFDLTSIPVGADVFVDSATGTQRFTVTTREQTAKADVRLERYFTADGPARLTLITCGGAFSRSARHYQDNLIITATPAT